MFYLIKLQLRNLIAVDRISEFFIEKHRYRETDLLYPVRYSQIAI